MTWPYICYLWVQVYQSWTKRAKDASFRLRPFIDQIIASTALPYDARILCVGARNIREGRLWAQRGYHHVRAIDLMPSRGVEFGDFHRLRFADESFDLVFASHALEHAWDPDRALAEIVRVLRPNGYLFAAFPVAFQLTAHDRVDFGSAEGFLAHLPSLTKVRLLWQQKKLGEVALLATIYP